MSKIWFSADFHFGHDRPFIYEPRGFSTLEEMEETLIANWNSVIAPEDDCYVLGDIFLGGSGKEALARGQALLERLNGKLHLINGNHDTTKRIEFFPNIRNVVESGKWADTIVYKHNVYYLSHFPTITSSLERASGEGTIINLHGHIHDTNQFYHGLPFVYNVNLDANGMFPIEIEEIRAKIKTEIANCLAII